MGETILTPNQQRFLEFAAAAEVITKHYYLTGGTALAEFYLHHRLSEDLDFFTELPIDEVALQDWLKKTAKALKSDVTFQTLRGQLVYYFHFGQDVLKVDFAYFPFPPVGEYSTYKKLKIASLEDIAVNKVQAILSRARGRDYLDLYSILIKKTITFEVILSSYTLKFDVTIPVEQLAKRLQAVTDASDMPRFLGTIDWKWVENFFLDEAKKLESKIIR